MVNLTRKEMTRIARLMKRSDENREKVIIASRGIIKDSKKAIGFLHMGKIGDAEKILSNMASRLNGLDGDTGALNVARQEYVEAYTYMAFLKTGKIPSIGSVKSNIRPEDYLAGLCDLTGELSRKATLDVIGNIPENVPKIRDAIQDVMALILELNLRNGDLRRKSDSVKYNLKRVESVLYDIKLKGML